MARLLWELPKPVYFMGRQWNGVDIANIVTLTAIHVLSLLAPFHFTWSALWLAVALYFVTGVGVTLSYHRNLAHKSFKLPKWLEYLFAYCAVHSLQVHALNSILLSK
jgi:stearoyl-CoA desaturase (delta-9 desaturase)